MRLNVAVALKLAVQHNIRPLCAAKGGEVKEVVPTARAAVEKRLRAAVAEIARLGGAFCRDRMHNINSQNCHTARAGAHVNAVDRIVNLYISRP